MKRVRQVSMVERDVAETVRVTLRPKKLKPLFDVSTSIQGEKITEWTYPMLIMMRIELTAMAGKCVI